MYLENLTFDAVDPQRLGGFWEAVVGGERLTNELGIFETRLRISGGPVLDLCFQQVPESPSEPVRLHLDLLGGERQAAEVQRLLDMGASHCNVGQGDVPWVVLADPEGNAFCVMEDRDTYTETGPIAALPMDSADPVRDAELWVWLTGWSIVPGNAPRSLRHPSLRGPWLELCPEPSPKAGAKNRLHLDVRLESGDNRDQIAARISDFGGRQVAPGWGELPWQTFQDASGNEFCLLPSRA